MLLFTLSAVALVMLLITVLLFGVGQRLRVPAELSTLPKELLIVAAHPDDCVVLGGELADEVARQKGIVRIVYVTCGSEHRGDELAITRAKECEVAWRILGVAPDALSFLGIRQSTQPVGLPGATPEAIAEARAKLEQLFRGLGPGAHVLIPADAESNLDHRLTRKMALEAVLSSGRTDLEVYESAEYNDFVSIVWTPGKAILRLLTALPVVARFARGRSTDPGGLKGTGALVLPRDEARLKRKIEALEAFPSQNVANVLVRAFGRPDRIRKINRVTAPHDLEPALDGCVRLGLNLADASALWFWATVSVFVVLFGCLVTTLLSWVLPALSLAVSIALLVFGVRSVMKHALPERRAFDAGLIVCALLSALHALA